MKIALIHPPLWPPSGGNLYNRNLLAFAEAQGFPLHSECHVTLTPENIQLWLKAYDLLLWDSIYWSSLAELTRTIRQHPSVLLCHSLPSLNPLLSRAQITEFRQYEEKTIEAVSRVIATGKTVSYAITERFPHKPVCLCEPGMDTMLFNREHLKKRRDNTVSLVTVATLLPEKGYLDILRALSSLKYSHWHWHICGNTAADSDFTLQFRQTARARDLEGKITFHGALEHRQIRDVLAECDIFVNASHYESYCMAVSEAFAMGLPIISTTVGACPSFVRNNENGFLFTPGAISVLQDQLDMLIGNADLRSRFSQAQPPPLRSWTHVFDDFISCCQTTVEP